MNASAIRRASNFTLANGSSIPKLGLGTWKAPKGQVGPAVSHALKTGFRHIDCAWAYRNEDEVGEAIRNSNIPRQQLWLTSKLWNSFHHPDHVEKGLDATLKDLGTDHLDLYLMHWPVAFLNSNGSQIASVKGQDGKPIEDVALSNNISSTWAKMEEMVSKGKVRNIGISNFNIRRSDQLLRESKIKPVVNQVEVNWGVPNEELLAWSEAHGIKLQAYSPLGSSNNVARYLEEPVVKDVAERNGLTPAQVYLAWCLGRGIITLPKSVTPSRLEENFKMLEFQLPQSDIDHLTKEAQNKPIERTVDPTEAWGVEKDIFEDGEDQRRLGELKSGDAFHAPLPHEKPAREHYLDPRHDPSSTNPSGSRSIHTQANPSSFSTRSHPTPIQKILRSSSSSTRSLNNVRKFSTSTKVKATTAEAQPPSATEAPGISNSSLLLRSSDKEAKATPGLKWTDEDNRSGESRKMNMYTAIRDAQSLALGSDETACVFGEDVAFGGVFRSTMGLAEEYGKERVFNTPLSEQGIIGFAIGMATMGHTAIAEIQFADYIFPAFDQLVNEAAKYNYRSGGQHKAGKLTVRTPCQGVGHGALYHSQSVEQFFMPVPGLKVVMPRSPIQAKGLLLSAIRDPNPVIFLEPKVLYRSSVEQVPLDDFTLPLSSAEVLQSGNDITLLSWGAPLYSCEQAIQMLRNPPKSIEEHVPKDLRNANVELIDLRTILPWDRETVVKSVMKTGRCVIVHEAPVTAGVGAEIGSHLQESCFLRLEAPVCRVGGWDSPFPHVHETFYKPEQIRIIDALVRTLSY